MEAGEEKVETIRAASDLLKLMNVVESATGLWNYCEQKFGSRWNCSEFHDLGQKLRELGLQEVISGTD